MALGAIRRFLSGTGSAIRGGGSFSAGPGGSGLPPGLEGGATHRRLYAWRPSSEHVNSLLRAAGPTTIARARWLARNNGYAKSALRSWREATVGKGARPSSLILDEPTRLAVTLAWLDWTDEADAEGVTNFSGILRRCTGEVFLAGECFVRLRPRRPEDGLSVPLQLQVMPAEQLPLDHNAEAPNGNQIRMGIEFNRNLRDKREAYWLYRSNPSDQSLSLRDLITQNLVVRVPADQVIHVYDPGEAGQLRGLTGFHAAMVKLFHLDLYDDAEIERKKQAARHAAVITNTGEGTEIAQTDMENVPIAPYGPGAYLQLQPGEDIKFTEPSEVGGSYEPFQYRTLAAIAAGFGVPYGELSHDLTKANYASSRAGLVAFRLEVEAFQETVLRFQLLRRVWQAWMQAAVLAGAVPVTASQYLATPAEFNRFRVIWPKLPWIDPSKDARGEEIMVNNGYKSRDDVIESLGQDPEETDLRIKIAQERADRLGIGPFPAAARSVSASIGLAGDGMQADTADGAEGTPQGDSGDYPGQRTEGTDNAA